MRDLGEWKTQVPVRLDGSVVERIDKSIRDCGRFCEGRGPVIRQIVADAYRLIDEGILTLDSDGLQHVQGVHCNQCNQRKRGK